MKDKIFVDSNIWVYASIEGSNELQKRNIAIKLLSNNSNLCVSTQVLNEFYNVLIRYKINDDKILIYLNEIIENTHVSSQDIGTLKKAWIIRNI